MIFLSYAREDSGLAAKLADELGAAGFALIKDPPALQSNPHWRSAVLERMAASELLLVIWSRRARGSPWVDQEIRAFGRARVWVCVDDAGLVHQLDDRDIVVRDPRGLLPMLRQRLVTSGRTLERMSWDEPWRREQALEASRSAVKGVHRLRRPRRSLVEIDDGTLLLEPFAMKFHRVIDDTWLGEAPVTVGQFEQFLEETKVARDPSIDFAFEKSTPVVSVSWFEAAACAGWLGGGLPREDLWQRAAATPFNLVFATSDGGIGPDQAHYGLPFATGAAKPSEAYPPNPCGFRGMCGNTWDWCETAWDGYRAVRGGSWLDSPTFCRANARYRNAPMDRDCTIGFRVCIRTRRIRSFEHEII